MWKECEVIWGESQLSHPFNLLKMANRNKTTHSPATEEKKNKVYAHCLLEGAPSGTQCPPVLNAAAPARD